ncbi:tachylectin-2-like [Hyla sarda]|uniref:tachylectin-2-like n=1 Tax=Hyla sarda TaxID=327740 RepID=UPI0024C3FE4D|nr:tachylectin-2-like [Hyla sarda]
MADTNTLLLTVTEDFSVQMGIPPLHRLDRYKERASILGKVNNISHLACSPDGELFCIRQGDLYRGPMPSKKDVDWFTLAQRVGRIDWDRARRILFHPDGEFYVVTNNGEMYKGPAPDNEHLPWFYAVAKRIGDKYWNEYNILFFDLEGLLYGVHTDKFYNGAPPTEENASWIRTCIGGRDWERLTYFMGYTLDKKLWSVDKYNGNVYRGDTPTPQQLHYLINADYLGWSFNQYRFLAFTKDKTIKNIISFEFLTDQGDKTSETPEVLEEKIYDNRKSTSILRHSFKISKTLKESSSFTHEHGFTFEAGVETTFKSGIPRIAEAGVTVKMNMSTTHNWNFTKTNETESNFESSTDVELEPGKAIRMVASVLKAQITVPYKAKARTMFGAEVEVMGKWFGVSHYNLMVKQEDFTK